MPEYIVNQDNIARVTPDIWLARYWLSVRTLRGDDTGLSRAEAEEFLRGQALGNPSGAIRQRCWLAMDRYGVACVLGEGDIRLDENQGG